MLFPTLLLYAAFIAQNVDGPRFEVASIKRLGPASPIANGFEATPSRYSATAAGAAFVIRAFGLPSYLVANLDKVPNDFYQIIATLPEGAKQDDLPAMLLNLLIERFHLRYHRETREIKRFELHLAEVRTN